MTEEGLPLLVELNLDGTEVQGRLAQRFRLNPNVTEIGSDPKAGQSLVLPPGNFVHPRHCVIAHTEPGLVTGNKTSRNLSKHV